MLFPAVKDAVNNLLALQQEKGMVPRGSKLLADAELVPVMVMIYWPALSLLKAQALSRFHRS